MKSKLKKKTNSEKYKHLKKFKAPLRFVYGEDEGEVKDCLVFYNEKIAGTGFKMASTGKIFRCLFNSDGQISYAKLIAYRCGCVGISGFYQEDNIYVTSLYPPPSRALQARRLHRRRENAAHEEYIRENLNINFTGHQRSHETYIPIAAQHFEVSLVKKEPEFVADLDKPLNKTKKRKKIEKTEDQLENIQDKAIADLQAFKCAKKFLNAPTLRLELAKVGISIKDIDTTCDIINMAIVYMSNRAYKK